MVRLPCGVELDIIFWKDRDTTWSYRHAYLQAKEKHPVQIMSESSAFFKSSGLTNQHSDWQMDNSVIHIPIKSLTN